MNRQSAREMVSALDKEIDERCLDPEGRHVLKQKLRALFEELTKDDAPVFRTPLGSFHKIDR